MRVVWDPRKAATNLRKHGIRFSDAEAVLLDPLALTRDDPDTVDEPRHVTVGSDAAGRIVVVVFAFRGEMIRLISARPATRKERTQYEKGI